MEFKKDKEIKEFVKLMPKLEAPELCALAQLLGVQLFTDRVDEEKHAIPRDGAEIIEDVIVSYGVQNRADRRDILKGVKITTKGRED